MIEGLVLLDMASVIALLFVVLIGLPHGAFDGAIANHLGAGRSLADAAKFITCKPVCHRGKNLWRQFWVMADNTQKNTVHE